MARMAPNRSKMISDDLRIAPDGPRIAPHCPKMALDGHKMDPELLQMVLEWARGVSRVKVWSVFVLTVGHGSFDGV